MKTKTSSNPDRAAQRHASLSRRHFLRGIGACLALPAFESVLPGGLVAAETKAAGRLASSATGAPVRLAFVYFPNGAHQEHWWPAGDGADFKLGRTMQPLAALQRSIQVVGGLDHRNADPGNDGGGDHARANATFLTGERARKTDSADIRVGISADQIVAQRVGHLTRFPSLELSCDAVRKSGKCDSGYSCTYQFNISWASASIPMSPEPNPRLVFERLFGAGGPDERRRNFRLRQETQRSLLDFVLADAHALQRRLGRTDQEKLDEYLTSVREIEQRIRNAEGFGDAPDPRADTPAGIPPNYGEHMEIMFDLLAMAFETDSTRVATLLLAGDGTNRAFPQIGIPEGHHYCSHHRNNPDLMEKVAQIDLYYMQHFARFLKRLEEKKDLDGRSVLDNSMIVYGCGNSDGNRHTHTNLPILLAGGGGGTLTPGRHVKFGGVPMTNFMLTLADRLGAQGVDRLGDSTGRVEGI